MDIVSCRKIHQGVASPFAAPYGLFDLFIYTGRKGGVADIGVVGKDTILENENDNYELLDLKIGKCKFIVASLPENQLFSKVGHIKIGTKYPSVAKKYFLSKGKDVEIIKIDGSVELAPILGLCDGIVDIMVKAEDASKISRMVDKFDLATIDTKAIRESVLSQKDIKPMSDEEHDALLSKLMDEKSNPNKARTSKDGTPFEPSSKTLKKENKKKTVERKRSTATMDRPSVRQELKDIKQQQLKSSAPKYPVRKKSKKKVR